MSAGSRGTPAPRPARIALVHRGRDWIRGSEQCLLDLATGLDRTRFEPLVWCTAPTLVREARRLGVQAEMIEDWGEGPIPFRTARSRAQIVRMLRERRVALVHANMTELVGALLPPVRRLRLPLVAHLHMPVTDRGWRRYSLVHQVAAAVGVAQNVVEPLRADGMPPDRVRVIYNAVDAGRLGTGDALGLRAALGIPAGAAVAVSIGSLIHRKAHDVTLRALAIARARGADWRLIVCGDGEEDAALRALAADLGVGSAAHFLGYRSDVGAVLRDAGDLLVTSAREETLGLNVLEAGWLGLPIVASDIVAHREALDPGASGLLTPVEDPAGMADALVALAADPALRARLGARGREFVRERFAMERYVGEFAALYAELLARPRSDYGWAGGTSWPSEYYAWVRHFVERRLRPAARAA